MSLLFFFVTALFSLALTGLDFVIEGARAEIIISSCRFYRKLPGTMYLFERSEFQIDTS